MTRVIFEADYGDTEVIEEFHTIERINEAVEPYEMTDVEFQAEVAPLIRVWLDNPESDESEFTDYERGTIQRVEA